VNLIASENGAAIGMAAIFAEADVPGRTPWSGCGFTGGTGAAGRPKP
jgi:hypothetical protein